MAALSIQRTNVFFAFEKSLQPVAKISQNQIVTLETHDCFEGQLKSKSDLLDKLDWDHVNPATGPVYIEGTRPGDVLRVDILSMEVGENSIMVTLPGEGALGDIITEMETTVLKNSGDKVIFKDNVSVPARPMIGVIGVAPEEGKIPNGTPGPHGGNMDCTLVTAGASVYFTVGVEGALFGAGDFHAAMGDGEVVICGAETPGKFTFRAQVEPRLEGLPTPFIKTDRVVATVFSAPSLDAAADGATHAMANFLSKFAGLSTNDAGMLMSLAGELKFCQIVDPEKTVRFEFPLDVLSQLGYSI